MKMEKILICLIVTHCAMTVMAKQLCVEPNDLHKRLRRLNNGLDIRTLLIPHQYNSITAEIQHLRMLSKDLMRRGTCPNTTAKGNYPLMMRSSCPWYLDVDVDTQRYPQRILIASSNCHGRCVGSNAQQICEKVNKQIKVMRRKECQHGVYTYKSETLLLPIAYTCASPAEIENTSYTNIEKNPNLC